MTTHPRTVLSSYLLCVTLGVLGTVGCGATAVVGQPVDASVTTDVPVSLPDRPMTTPDVPSTMPTTCPLVGRYTGSIESNALWFEFTAGGLWRGSQTEEGLTTPIVEGNYALTGSNLVLTDERNPNTSSSSGCAMIDRGQYTINFTTDCTTLRFDRLGDDCEGRGQFFSQVALGRRR